MRRTSLAALLTMVAAACAFSQSEEFEGLTPGTTPYKQAAQARESLRKPPPGPNSAEAARKILSSKEFSDPGAVEQREVLKSTKKETQGFFERLGAGIGRLISSMFSSSGPGSALPVPPWVWIGIAGLIVAGFIVAVLLDRQGKARLAADLMDEEEDKLTADEWLDRADKLEAQGFYRDAYRCLYVALLVRLSEFRIVPFRKYETNWEHVRRAERNPDCPEMLGLRATTRQFDLFWYGRKPIGKEQVASLREHYVRAYRVLEGRAA